MHIAIIYNLADELLRGTERDRLADSEVLEVAVAVRAALERKGHTAGVYNVCHNGLIGLPRSDAIFNLAETTLGSDITEDVIAENLEESGLPFTGADAAALRKCANKPLTKSILISRGLPTPRYQVCRHEDEIRTELPYPLIVKPVHEDGSIGIDEDSVVWDARHLERKVLEVLSKYQQPALIEEFIDGREINAAVIGNGTNARVLPLSEIAFSLEEGRPRIVPFGGKWVEGSVYYQNIVNRCPADLDPASEAAIRAIALEACSLLGCRDYTRVDMRLRDGVPFVLEVNPNPGINPVGTGFIVSATAAQYSYDGIVNEILACALARSSAFLPPVVAWSQVAEP